jgi:HD-GYP domain-containing protein (c-di-GMP phosphodiesterase class II)
MDFLHTLAGQAAIAIDNSHLFENLQRSNQELVQAYDTTLEGWARALELRDQETEGHTRRVTELTLRLAKYMGIRDSDLVDIRRGVLLHDIGKMGVPDNILKKTGRLSDTEWVEMRKHPVYAYNLLSPIEYLRDALDIPYCHHEHWDGSGYPRGLKGTQIPLSARIFSIVDIWDALLSDRPYRKAWPVPKVLAYMKEIAGKQVDPDILLVFLKMIKETDYETG